MRPINQIGYKIYEADINTFENKCLDGWLLNSGITLEIPDSEDYIKLSVTDSANAWATFGQVLKSGITQTIGRYVIASILYRGSSNGASIALYCSNRNQWLNSIDLPYSDDWALKYVSIDNRYGDIIQNCTLDDYLSLHIYPSTLGAVKANSLEIKAVKLETSDWRNDSTLAYKINGEYVVNLDSYNRDLELLECKNHMIRISPSPISVYTPIGFVRNSFIYNNIKYVTVIFNIPNNFQKTPSVYFKGDFRLMNYNIYSETVKLGVLSQIVQTEANITCTFTCENNSYDPAYGWFLVDYNEDTSEDFMIFCD